MSTRKDLDWWHQTAPELDWTFAKTMPETPHDYVIRGKAMSSPDFERAVRVIRTFGEPGKFFARTHIYLVDRVAGYRWWTMGDTLENTTVINRAPHDQTFGKQDAPRTFSGVEVPLYDEMAQIYDRRYTSPSDLAENRAVQRLVAEHVREYAPKILDIGCGTGLALDLRLTHPSLYTGVDPSQAMLNELVRKHPKVTRLLPGRWEDVARDCPQGFEVILSLFGSASYISPQMIGSIPDFSTSRSLTILMHYKDGYLPDYEREQILFDSYRAEQMAESRDMATRIKGAHVFEINNFQVVTVNRD